MDLSHKINDYLLTLATPTNEPDERSENLGVSTIPISSILALYPPFTLRILRSAAFMSKETKSDVLSRGVGEISPFGLFNLFTKPRNIQVYSRVPLSKETREKLVQMLVPKINEQGEMEIRSPDALVEELRSLWKYAIRKASQEGTEVPDVEQLPSAGSEDYFEVLFREGLQGNKAAIPAAEIKRRVEVAAEILIKENIIMTREAIERDVLLSPRKWILPTEMTPSARHILNRILKLVMTYYKRKGIKGIEDIYGKYYRIEEIPDRKVYRLIFKDVSVKGREMVSIEIPRFKALDRLYAPLPDQFGPVLTAQEIASMVYEDAPIYDVGTTTRYYYSPKVTVTPRKDKLRKLTLSLPQRELYLYLDKHLKVMERKLTSEVPDITGHTFRKLFQDIQNLIKSSDIAQIEGVMYNIDTKTIPEYYISMVNIEKAKRINLANQKLIEDAIEYVMGSSGSRKLIEIVGLPVRSAKVKALPAFLLSSLKTRFSSPSSLIHGRITVPAELPSSVRRALGLTERTNFEISRIPVQIGGNIAGKVSSLAATKVSLSGILRYPIPIVKVKVTIPTEIINMLKRAGVKVDSDKLAEELFGDISYQIDRGNRINPRGLLQDLSTRIKAIKTVGKNKIPEAIEARLKELMLTDISSLLMHATKSKEFPFLVYRNVGGETVSIDSINKRLKKYSKYFTVEIHEKYKTMPVQIAPPSLGYVARPTVFFSQGIADIIGNARDSSLFISRLESTPGLQNASYTFDVDKLQIGEKTPHHAFVWTTSIIRSHIVSVTSDNRVLVKAPQDEFMTDIKFRPKETSESKPGLSAKIATKIRKAVQSGKNFINLTKDEMRLLRMPDAEIADPALSERKQTKTVYFNLERASKDGREVIINLVTSKTAESEFLGTVNISLKSQQEPISRVTLSFGIASRIGGRLGDLMSKWSANLPIGTSVVGDTLMSKGYNRDSNFTRAVFEQIVWGLVNRDLKNAELSFLRALEPTILTEEAVSTGQPLDTEAILSALGSTSPKSSKTKGVPASITSIAIPTPSGKPEMLYRIRAKHVIEPINRLFKEVFLKDKTVVASTKGKKKVTEFSKAKRNFIDSIDVLVSPSGSVSVRVNYTKDAVLFMESGFKDDIADLMYEFYVLRDLPAETKTSTISEDPNLQKLRQKARQVDIKIAEILSDIYGNTVKYLEEKARAGTLTEIEKKMLSPQYRSEPELPGLEMTVKPEPQALKKTITDKKGIAESMRGIQSGRSKLKVARYYNFVSNLFYSEYIGDLQGTMSYTNSVINLFQGEGNRIATAFMLNYETGARRGGFQYGSRVSEQIGSVDIHGIKGAPVIDYFTLYSLERTSPSYYQFLMKMMAARDRFTFHRNRLIEKLLYAYSYKPASDPTVIAAKEFVRQEMISKSMITESLKRQGILGFPYWFSIPTAAEIASTYTPENHAKFVKELRKTLPTKDLIENLIEVVRAQRLTSYKQTKKMTLSDAQILELENKFLEKMGLNSDVLLNNEALLYLQRFIGRMGDALSVYDRDRGLVKLVKNNIKVYKLNTSVYIPTIPTAEIAARTNILFIPVPNTFEDVRNAPVEEIFELVSKGFVTGLMEEQQLRPKIEAAKRVVYDMIYGIGEGDKFSQSLYYLNPKFRNVLTAIAANEAMQLIEKHYAKASVDREDIETTTEILKNILSKSVMQYYESVHAELRGKQALIKRRAIAPPLSVMGKLHSLDNPVFSALHSLTGSGDVVLLNLRAVNELVQSALPVANEIISEVRKLRGIARDAFAASTGIPRMPVPAPEVATPTPADDEISSLIKAFSDIMGSDISTSKPGDPASQVPLDVVTTSDYEREVTSSLTGLVRQPSRAERYLNRRRGVRRTARTHLGRRIAIDFIKKDKFTEYFVSTIDGGTGAYEMLVGELKFKSTLAEKAKESAYLENKMMNRIASLALLFRSSRIGHTYKAQTLQFLYKNIPSYLKAAFNIAEDGRLTKNATALIDAVNNFIGSIIGSVTWTEIRRRAKILYLQGRNATLNYLESRMQDLFNELAKLSLPEGRTAQEIFANRIKAIHEIGFSNLSRAQITMVKEYLKWLSRQVLKSGIMANDELSNDLMMMTSLSRILDRALAVGSSSSTVELFMGTRVSISTYYSQKIRLDTLTSNTTHIGSGIDLTVSDYYLGSLYDTSRSRVLNTKSKLYLNRLQSLYKRIEAARSSNELERLQAKRAKIQGAKEMAAETRSVALPSPSGVYEESTGTKGLNKRSLMKIADWLTSIARDLEEIASIKTDNDIERITTSDPLGLQRKVYRDFRKLRAINKLVERAMLESESILTERESKALKSFHGILGRILSEADMVMKEFQVMHKAVRFITSEVGLPVLLHANPNIHPHIHTINVQAKYLTSKQLEALKEVAKSGRLTEEQGRVIDKLILDITNALRGKDSSIYVAPHTAAILGRDFDGDIASVFSTLVASHFGDKKTEFLFEYLKSVVERKLYFLEDDNWIAGSTLTAQTNEAIHKTGDFALEYIVSPLKSYLDETVKKYVKLALDNPTPEEITKHTQNIRRRIEEYVVNAYSDLNGIKIRPESNDKFFEEILTKAFVATRQEIIRDTKVSKGTFLIRLASEVPEAGHLPLKVYEGKGVEPITFTGFIKRIFAPEVTKWIELGLKNVDELVKEADERFKKVHAAAEKKAEVIPDHLKAEVQTVKSTIIEALGDVSAVTRQKTLSGILYYYPTFIKLLSRELLGESMYETEKAKAFDSLVVQHAYLFQQYVAISAKKGTPNLAVGVHAFFKALQDIARDYAEGRRQKDKTPFEVFLTRMNKVLEEVANFGFLIELPAEDKRAAFKSGYYNFLAKIPEAYKQYSEIGAKYIGTKPSIMHVRDYIRYGLFKVRILDTFIETLTGKGFDRDKVGTKMKEAANWLVSSVSLDWGSVESFGVRRELEETASQVAWNLFWTIKKDVDAIAGKQGKVVTPNTEEARLGLAKVAYGYREVLLEKIKSAIKYNAMFRENLTVGAVAVSSLFQEAIRTKVFTKLYSIYNLGMNVVDGIINEQNINDIVSQNLLKGIVDPKQAAAFATEFASLFGKDASESSFIVDTILAMARTPREDEQIKGKQSFTKTKSIPPPVFKELSSIVTDAGKNKLTAIAGAVGLVSAFSVDTKTGIDLKYTWDKKKEYTQALPTSIIKRYNGVVTMEYAPKWAREKVEKHKVIEAVRIANFKQLLSNLPSSVPPQEVLFNLPELL